MANCKNCGHIIQEDQKFCPECGQKNRDKLTFKVLMGELASAFLSWDSKFFRTIVPLITKPGKVSKEYLSGKRKTFVAPMRLYLFFSFLFFFTLSVLNDTPSFNLSVADAEAEVQVDTLNDDTLRMNLAFEPFKMHKDDLRELIEKDRLDEVPQIRDEKSKFYKKLWKQMLVVAANGGSFVAQMQENISIMFFFFLPAFGLVLWLFFLNSKLDYIEHLIYGIYFHSFFFFILWIVMLISRLIGDEFPLLIGILYMLIYLIVGVKRFYDVGTGMAIIKSVFLSLVYFITFLIFILVTMVVSIYFF